MFLLETRHFICSNSHSNQHLGKENEQDSKAIWSTHQECVSPYALEVCAEPEWDMAGAHSFHIHELVLTVEKKVSIN